MRLADIVRIASSSLALVLASPAQDDGCRECSGHGVRECKRHRGLEELEAAVEWCSEAVACKTCGGTLQRDCRSCVTATAEAELARRHELAAQWMAARREAVDRVTEGRDLMHLRTAQLDLTFSVRPLTVGRTKLDSHRLMHLYASRIHDLREQVKQVFGYSDASFSARLQVYLFKERIDFDRLAPRVTGQGVGATSTKLMGADCVYCAVHDARQMPSDEDLHRNVVHNVTHLLMANARPERWLGNRKCGWLDEGVAHWFEDRITGKCTNFCYEEVGVPIGAGFKGGRWRVPVRRMLEAGKLDSFARLSQLNTDEMKFVDHAHAFACVDFLIARDGGPALARMIERLKKNEELRMVMSETHGLNPLTFDDAFRAWVVETYPLQEGR